MSTPPASTTRARVGWLSPRLWGLHALVVVAVTFTVFMGLWQMGVYDDRRAEAQTDQTTASVVPLQDVLGPDDPFTTTASSRTVALTGTFAPADQQVWVSGREQSGRDGYWLLAPVLVDEVAGASDRPAALLVVALTERPDLFAAAGAKPRAAPPASSPRSGARTPIGRRTGRRRATTSQTRSASSASGPPCAPTRSSGASA